jgi:dephospho-CoA kinase
MNYLVGLTGGIGSGKSTVADMFAALGARIIDTDLISRQLTQAGGEAIPAIGDAFGPQLIDREGALNRDRMRELIFNNASEKKRLEAILHPLIFARAKRESLLPTNAPYTLIVVPLLFESGRYAEWLHLVITVDCAEDVQIARTMARSNLDGAAVRAIMAQQLERSERMGLADEVIHNDGTLLDLQSQVDSMHRRLCALAAESN